MGQNGDEKSSLISSPKEDNPVRAIVCLRNKEDIKHFEEIECCFILEFDPFESLDLSKISLDNNDDDAIDVSIVAKKGPVDTTSILLSHYKISFIYLFISVLQNLFYIVTILFCYKVCLISTHNYCC